VTSSPKRRSVEPRADRTLPGVWRLRLPLPWPGVPHGNAWAVAAGEGVVLFDTGIGGADKLPGLERALAQAGFSLKDIGLVVCTHSHVDHYGLAAPIAAAAGCEVWVHPAWGHVRRLVENPDEALDQRIEVARQSGVPAAGLEEYEKRRRNADLGIDELKEPDRDLVPGVEAETDLGPWQVYETPGHAPSHVCLYQPERKLLISGDHLLGRVSLFYDYGHTPDPVGEFLGGLDAIAPLDIDLCLAGHGRPFRDVGAKIEANRREVAEQMDRVRGSLAGGEEKTAFETVTDLLGPENLNPATAAWGLQGALAYLDHMALTGEAEPVDGTDPVRWRLRD
jgi:glyoxylase-like metal-dependent hydrolase (beta-lactamase superfamily II)